MAGISTCQCYLPTAAAVLPCTVLYCRYSRGGLMESAFYMQVANALLPPLGE